MSDDKKVHSKTVQKALGGLSAMNKATGGVVDFAGNMASSLTGGSNIANSAPDPIGTAIGIGKALNRMGVRSVSNGKQKENISPDATPNQPKEQSRGK